MSDHSVIRTPHRFFLRMPVTLLAAFVVMVALSSCSWLSDWPQDSNDHAAAPYPENVVVAQKAPAYTAGVEEIDRSAASLTTGVRGDDDVMARLAALENEVQLIRNDVKTMMPALTRLAGVQNTMRSRIADIEPAAGTPVSVAPPVPKSAPIQPAAAQATAPVTRPAPEASPVKASSAGAVVKDMRVGNHPDRVRLVLDVSDNVSFSQNLDNDGRVLTVFLNDTDWTAPVEQYFADSPLLYSYAVSHDGGRTILTLHLRDHTRILSTASLPPSEGKSYRVLIDLAKPA